MRWEYEAGWIPLNSVFVATLNGMSKQGWDLQEMPMQKQYPAEIFCVFRRPYVEPPEPEPESTMRVIERL